MSIPDKKENTKEEIINEIIAINNKNDLQGDDVSLLIRNLISLEIDTYEYYLWANKSVQGLKRGSYKHFLDKLEDPDREIAFTAFYLLAYSYWEDGKTDDLRGLITEQGEKYLDYALWFQMKGRLARRNKEFCQALESDKKALEILKEKDIENIGIKVTTAATVANALENDNFSAIKIDDISTAIDNTNYALKTAEDYHKYNYLMGKLLLYREYWKCCEEEYYQRNEDAIKKAQEYLQEAIDNLNQTSDSYIKTKNKYNNYIANAHTIEEELKKISLLVLYETSSEEDIRGFIVNKLNEYRRSPRKRLVIISLIRNVINLKIDSSKFAFASEYICELKCESFYEELSCYLHEDREVTETVYTAVVLYSFYLWEKKQIDELSRLNDRYFSWFSDNYALIHQIKGRIYRNSGEYRNALVEDNKAMMILENNKIDNKRLAYTKAATVAKALEKEKYDQINEIDIEDAKKIANNAINMNKEYHKWYYLKAKLLIFSEYYYYLKNNESYDDENYNNLYASFKKAKEDLMKAVEYLDISSKDYYGIRMKYEHYNIQADKFESEIKLKRGFQKNNTKLKEDLVTIVEKQKAIEATIHNEQIKYLEILAVFVSIISIIITIIGTLGRRESVVEMMIIIASMCISVIAVYAAFLFILHDDATVEVTKKRCYTVIVCVLLLFSMAGIYSYCCKETQTNVTKPEAIDEKEPEDLKEIEWDQTIEEIVDSVKMNN